LDVNLFVFQSSVFSTLSIKNWQETHSRITDYKVELTKDGEAWQKKVYYTYPANGQILTGDTLSKNLNIAFSSKDHTEKYYNDYQIGQEVTVRYNPKNPEEVIECKFDWINTLWLAFGIGAFVFGYYMFPY
jgi:PDZ domain-containing secreted protein